MARPRTVTVAYVLWLVAAVVLVLLALLVLTAPVDRLRQTLADGGASTSDIDSYLSTMRVVGGVSAVFGLAVGFLAGPMRAGNTRCRKILVGLSVFVALGLLFVVLALQLFQEMLVVVIVLAAACALVYRPAARSWFARV